MKSLRKLICPKTVVEIFSKSFTKRFRGIGQLVKNSTRRMWQIDGLLIGLALVLGLVFDSYESA